MPALRVRVQPGASRNRVDAYEDGTLRLRVTAPPEAGRANVAVTQLVADSLGISRSRVKIVRGAASRNKLLEIAGLNSSVLTELLIQFTKQGRD